MARKPRVEFPGGLYHVIARGNNRQRIFRAAQDSAAYLRRLETYRNRYAVSLYAYVLMPNHVHLLLETGTSPLSKFMQGLQQSYTLYFNRRHKHVGHLFQGRYRAILCDRENYLLELIRYLHLNPVRAGLVRTPEVYPWSSHHAYLGKPGELRVATDLPLSHFSIRPETAARRYTQFLGEGLPQGHRKDLYDVFDHRFLGSEQFAASVERRAGRGERRDPPRLARASLDECLGLVTRHLGLEPEAIRSNARLRALTHGRRLFILLACRHSGHTATEIGRFLGVDPSGVSNALRWWDHHLLGDPKGEQDVQAVLQAARNMVRKFRKV